MRRVFCVLFVLWLAACGRDDSASYMVSGNRDHALSLFRTKAWYWSDWELALVVARQPECLRRHLLAVAPAAGEFKVELYRTGEGGFILHQDRNWFVAETGKCRMQAFKTPPPEPGELLGSWTDSDGGFKFVAAAVPAASR
ncbi:MAG: hypothetical protein M0P39_10890 [Rhodocyclaceae bacterium]|jgi:hypothetical protein|nr:hypothetical protein [Rhodocyclaceae bacterium]